MCSSLQPLQTLDPGPACCSCTCTSPHVRHAVCARQRSVLRGCFGPSTWVIGSMRLIPQSYVVFLDQHRAYSCEQEPRTGTLKPNVTRYLPPCTVEPPRSQRASHPDDLITADWTQPENSSVRGRGRTSSASVPLWLASFSSLLPAALSSFASEQSTPLLAARVDICEKNCRMGLICGAVLERGASGAGSSGGGARLLRASASPLAVVVPVICHAAHHAPRKTLHGAGLTLQRTAPSQPMLHIAVCRMFSMLLVSCAGDKSSNL